MIKLIRKLELTEDGRRDLVRMCIAECFRRLSDALPLACCGLVMRWVLDQAGGGSGNGLALPALVSAAGALIMSLCVKKAFDANFTPTYREEERMMCRLAARMRTLPMSFYDGKDDRSLADALTSDFAAVEKVISGMIPSFVSFIAVMPLLAAAMALIDPGLTLAMCCGIPAAFGIQTGSLGLQSALTKLQLQQKRQSSETMNEYIEGLKVIRSGAGAGRLENDLKSFSASSRKMEFTAGFFVASAEVFLSAGIGAVIYFGSERLSAAPSALPVFLLFIMASFRIMEPLASMLSSLSNMVYMSRSVERIRELFDAPVTAGTDEASDGYDIRFRGVGFSYEGDLPTLSDISFEIPSGSVTAFVGPSGSGKTTVTRLLMREWEPGSGEITIGGKSIAGMDTDEIARNICCVFQNVVLFSGSIYDNIRIGDPSASDERIRQAARLACCEEFIDELPDGIHTNISENGLSLSGGQRQRIAVARALLRDAPILILDEPASALDPGNEKLLQKALSALVERGKTVIIIAHRIRTVCDADEIIVLDEGRVAGRGSHAQLLESCPVYRLMYELQEDASRWSVGGSCSEEMSLEPVSFT